MTNRDQKHGTRKKKENQPDSLLHLFLNLTLIFQLSVLFLKWNVKKNQLHYIQFLHPDDWNLKCYRYLKHSRHFWLAKRERERERERRAKSLKIKRIWHVEEISTERRRNRFWRRCSHFVLRNKCWLVCDSSFHCGTSYHGLERGWCGRRRRGNCCKRWKDPKSFLQLTQCRP